jgi:hypothetical protein
MLFWKWTEPVDAFILELELVVEIDEIDDEIDVDTEVDVEIDVEFDVDVEVEVESTTTCCVGTISRRCKFFNCPAFKIAMACTINALSMFLRT